jgi:hypothetical protein
MAKKSKILIFYTEPGFDKETGASAPEICFRIKKEKNRFYLKILYIHPLRN